MYTVKEYNFVHHRWDTLKYFDYPNDGKKKDGVFKTKDRAEYVMQLAYCLSGGLGMKFKVEEVKK